jgi:hypothetical protein
VSKADSLFTKQITFVGLPRFLENVSKFKQELSWTWRGWWEIKRYYVSYSASCVKYYLWYDKGTYLDFFSIMDICGWLQFILPKMSDY